MSSLRDPLEFATEEGRDLQGIATWEPRSALDSLLVTVFPTSLYTWIAGKPGSLLSDRTAGYLSILVRALIFLVGLLVFVGVVLVLGYQVLTNPGSLIFLVLFPISVIPALLLAAYVWYTDVTSEPILALVATYLLGIVLASFPYLINTAVAAVVSIAAQALPPALSSDPSLTFLVQAAQFYLVVAPVEEASKLGAVILFVYWRPDFDTVIDGAVYGAVAGLGFATIENTSYIIQTVASVDSPLGVLLVGGVITTVRAIAGPGHVIWTGIAGYYLGLAKFNREYSLAIVAKGLLIAVVLHGTYNATVTGIPLAFQLLGVGVVGSLLSFGFIFVYDTTFFGYLFLKLRRYRKTYAEVSPGDHAAHVSEIDGYEAMRGGTDSPATASDRRRAEWDDGTGTTGDEGTSETGDEGTGSGWGATVGDEYAEESDDDGHGTRRTDR